MDANKTLHKLRGESDRSSTTVYLSKTIHDEFKELCGKISPSRVLEELMREFIDDMKPRARASILKKATNKKS